MEDIELIVAIVAGLFSLLGGFLGAFLTRRTEYEKWLRQQRSIAFAGFISHLNQFRKAAVDILYDTSLDQEDKDMAITECFYELNSQEHIVRLYLTGSTRERFSELKSEIWSAYSPAVNQTTRLNTLKNATSEIQEIFEGVLHG
ncbi:hypothetical protein [Vreelandella piezotolerans]|uniref:Uncharacterized protein n=1 Tax=Vreelandella piezotolerans TaxID=2609667 RepID=A0ABQ6X4B3_9GAMM|nr:hypothetical protein [Halomonas piezotolerans]KAE8436616.1 hypothetical protein F1978_17595 [Halomonas piezotolerans]QJA24341.1 hypothetical protein GYM47_09615 [Halomonas piezotolerans]